MNIEKAPYTVAADKYERIELTAGDKKESVDVRKVQVVQNGKLTNVTGNIIGKEVAIMHLAVGQERTMPSVPGEPEEGTEIFNKVYVVGTHEEIETLLREKNNEV